MDRPQRRQQYALVFRRKPKIRRAIAIMLALVADDHGLIGIAKPRRGLDQRIEHRLQIERSSG